MIEALQKIIEAFTVNADIGHLALIIVAGFVAWLHHHERARVEQIQAEKYDLAIRQIETGSEIALTLQGISQTLTAILERVR